MTTISPTGAIEVDKDDGLDSVLNSIHGGPVLVEDDHFWSNMTENAGRR